jgi:curved DNA-binding protein CbpA
MDPYGVLGLEPGASQVEVKRAYRRLAKVLHPDTAGEAALPRFLEIQEAYERLTGTKVRTVRAPGSPAPPSSGSPAPGGGTEGFREPWRADPARARAAREQARTRAQPRWPGGQAGRASEAAGRAGRGGAMDGADAAPGPRSGSGTSGRRSSGGPSHGAGAGGRPNPGSGGDGSSRSGGRRRSSRKATLGSTSYDEARDPADRSWAGASWYGPTTGEYWHINPREYADPRKHGPGYTSRGRADEPSSGPDAVEADRRDGPADPSRSATSRSRTADRASQPATGSSGPAVAPAPRSAPTPPSPPPATPVGGGEAGSTFGPARLMASPGWRRVGLVLLAWPPLGLAAATAIGQTTGCLSYSASCDSTDRLLPWAAQALLLALLAASPWLTRILVAGTIGAIVALVPGVGIITALGGASSSEGGPVLAAWLGLAWLVGVVIGATRAHRGSADPVGNG